MQKWSSCIFTWKLVEQWQTVALAWNSCVGDFVAAQKPFEYLQEAPKQTLCSFLTSDMLDIASNSVVKTSCTNSSTSVADTRQWGDSGRKVNGPILVVKKLNLVFYRILVCFCHCIFVVPMQIDQNRLNFLKINKSCITFTATMSRRRTGQNMGFHGLCHHLLYL